MHSFRKNLFFAVVASLSTVAAFLIVGCTKETTTQPLAGDANWTEVGTAGAPSFQNSWTNYDTTNYSTCAFRKDGENFVYLKGTLTGGTENSIIFRLPAGYRPVRLLEFNPYGGTYNSSIGIDSAGYVKKGPNYNTFVSLDGIVFHAEQ